MDSLIHETLLVNKTENGSIWSHTDKYVFTDLRENFSQCDSSAGVYFYLNRNERTYVYLTQFLPLRYTHSATFAKCQTDSTMKWLKHQSCDFNKTFISSTKMDPFWKMDYRESWWKSWVNEAGYWGQIQRKQVSKTTWNEVKKCLKEPIFPIYFHCVSNWCATRCWETDLQRCWVTFESLVYARLITLLSLFYWWYRS